MKQNEYEGGVMLQKVIAAIANDEMATKVRNATIERGRTDQSLAEATNITPSTYNRKIQGVNYEFTPTELLAIAAQLEMNPLDLLPSAFFSHAQSGADLAPSPSNVAAAA